MGMGRILKSVCVSEFRIADLSFWKRKRYLKTSMKELKMN
jgi:hypothetical protein